MDSSKRTYNQRCHVARALDLVGERWTLLLVRELLTGPKRFGELHEELEGIGTNLLTTRLRELESEALVERLPDRESRRPLYRLTEKGRALRPVLREVYSWAAGWGIGETLASSARPVSASRAFALFCEPDASSWRGRVLLRTDDEQIYARVTDDGLETQNDDEAVPVDLTIEADIDTWQRLGSGEWSIAKAIRTGQLSYEGRRTELEGFLKLFGIPPAINTATR